MRICPQCGTRFNEPVQFCPNDGAPTYEAMEQTEAPPDPLLGLVIDGRYRIEQQIGEGGMGVVYMATHTTLQKKLALKVLRGDGSKDAEVVQRFMQEAQAATSIGHQNIIDISDFGRLPDGDVYFVMEFLDGQSIADLIKHGGSVPLQQAIHLISQMASALEAAHNRGIVHRDLKPDNIFIVKQGGDPNFIKVLDFGVAKVGGAASKLTKTGMVFGTPHYMSPEQAAGHSVDQRTDIYALGVIMYEMFSGRVPFDADTFMGILSKHMFEVPPPPRDLSGASLGVIEGVILRSLEKNADHRYQSMTELLRDLETIAAGGTIDHSRPAAPPPGNLADALEPAARVEPALAQSGGGGGPGKALVLGAVAALALLFVGGVVATGVFFLTGGDDGDAQAQVVDEAPAPSVTVAPAAAGPATPAIPPPAATPAPPTVAQPAPEPVAMVAIASIPAGAEVLIDGVMVGNTPVELPRPETGSQQVTMRLRGHQESTVEISPQTGGSLSVTLQPQPRVSVRRPPTPRASPVVRHPPPPRTRRRASTSEVVDPWN